MKSPKKSSIASKMVSKEYTHTRCGDCGKFGHHHTKCTSSKMGRTATPSDRKKDPYLSADSRVYPK